MSACSDCYWVEFLDEIEAVKTIMTEQHQTWAEASLEKLHERVTKRRHVNGSQKGFLDGVRDRLEKGSVEHSE